MNNLYSYPRKPLVALAGLALLLAHTAPLAAQVPAMLNYQGRVLVNGTNFTGSGQFKFALVQGAGPTLLWKNDGSGGNTEPTTPVPLPVANGLVMTSVGDTPMIPIPSSVFANSDVRLRVWFNGGLGFQQLTPDQRIVSVGYAMRAETVPDGSITATKLAAGAITSASLSNNLALGTSNSLNGRLDVYRTAANTPGVSLIGGNSQISTYGTDGLEQIRLWGPSYGEVLLNNSLADNATAARLTANGSTGGLLELRNTNGVNRATLSGANSGGSMTLYAADGSIGVQALGDSGGAGYLSVRGTNGSTRASMDGSDNGGGSVRLYENDGTETITLTAEGNGNLVLHQGDGSTGAAMSANNGTGGGGFTVYRDTGTFAGQLTVGGTSGFLGVANSNGNNRVYAQGSNPGGSQGGYIGLLNSAGAQTITLDADSAGDGKITTQVLQITGGSDLSENFDIKSIQAELRAGQIVCIDPERPGQLITSSKAYDKSVAGIVSGAGGVKTGMLMGQQGTAANGRHPVALSGRVYCWLDADHGAVKPGDLITTSDTPGHGMKVRNHRKAQGAIIGKAMSSLEHGRGLVLVLVSLQ